MYLISIFLVILLKRKLTKLTKIYLINKTPKLSNVSGRRQRVFSFDRYFAYYRSWVSLKIKKNIPTTFIKFQNTFKIFVRRNKEIVSVALILTVSFVKIIKLLLQALHPTCSILASKVTDSAAQVHDRVVGGLSTVPLRFQSCFACQTYCTLPKHFYKPTFYDLVFHLLKALLTPAVFLKCHWWLVTGATFPSSCHFNI